MTSQTTAAGARVAKVIAKLKEAADWIESENNSRRVPLENDAKFVRSCRRTIRAAVAKTGGA